jgi:hypothetical protein
MALVVLGALTVTGFEAHYPAALYPLLLAAGALSVERLTEGKERALLRGALALAFAAGALLFVPAVLRVFPLARADRYRALFAIPDEISWLHHAESGWPEYAGQLAGLVQEKATQASASAILTESYWQASVLEYYGPALRLPAVMSGHYQYYLWGPRRAQRVLAVGFTRERLQVLFHSVTELGALPSAFGADPVFLCAGTKSSWSELWPTLKRF